MTTQVQKYTDTQLCAIIHKVLNVLNLEDDAKSVAVNYLYELAYNHTSTTDFNIKIEAFLNKAGA